MAIQKLSSIVILLFALCSNANADVWRWVDSNGDMHFVDTNRPIFTWRDEYGKVHFSDRPDNADAVSVELTWHSAGSLQQEGVSLTGGSNPYSGETVAERWKRRQEEKHRCKQASDVFDSYTHAKRLYETDENGNKVYLSAEAAATKLAETKIIVDERCK